ncbi:MAG: hypothetical protein PHV98_06805, partial [Candidatus Omnitrophica bacterium]|nr:hypothetical protein [Candidatus Omnitrophota bacterium]
MPVKKKKAQLSRALPQAALAAAIIAGIFCFGGESSATSIDPEKKYAYSGATGWANLNSTNGQAAAEEGALSGYIWSENTGWINLNADPEYNPGGLAIDGSGNVSGFAWGEKVGWIKFDSTNGRVSIDSLGNFSGYAWGENTGWLKFTPDANNYIGVKLLDVFALAGASPGGYAQVDTAKTVVVTAKGWKGATDTGYSPATTVSVSATGSSTVSPALLTAADFSLGAAEVQVTWTSLGNYNVTAVDDSAAGVTGSSPAIEVINVAVDSALAGPSSVTAGSISG